MRTTVHDVEGIIFTNMPKEAKLTVRITSDKIGKSLSISDDENLMYMIPLEPILKRLKEVVNE